MCNSDYNQLSVPTHDCRNVERWKIEGLLKLFLAYWVVIWIKNYGFENIIVVPGFPSNIRHTTFFQLDRPAGERWRKIECPIIECFLNSFWNTELMKDFIVGFTPKIYILSKKLWNFAPKHFLDTPLIQSTESASSGFGFEHKLSYPNFFNQKINKACISFKNQNSFPGVLWVIRAVLDQAILCLFNWSICCFGCFWIQLFYRFCPFENVASFICLKFYLVF